ncbi:ABC transporter ATP-binding protein [Paenirhodobacter populi]|uniref:ABC transporter ATP-binding protein n=1 Tax=Paenirhodobacter populi TaxID=2306993 RepID=A0A443IM35_9RHOB|nr:ABC transporter ATP-binding protein [Sinirhodobacter populi]RWR05453.1 ABC transporter ATP-binding protein [Sinirhodobacter populi]RWR06559.1 ABC transporter ATP-binding protein [Sinirhodobacter populi]RWR19595.1 ABC transporter ATP-binding protein [Sinirhodobacter populi]
MILSVHDLKVNYGAIPGIRKIDFDVNEGEIVALIGANGAGKSTTMRAITGLLPFQGRVVYRGRDLAPMHAERNLANGLALVPEGRGILTRMTVEENLRMGGYLRRDKAQLETEIVATYERFAILGERRSGIAGFLSGGEQQILAIARALLARPKLLLLDEPSLGLAPMMTAQIFDFISEFRKQGLTVLLAEQKSKHSLAIADRAFLFSMGEVVASGAARDLAEGSLIRNTMMALV